MSCSPLWLSQLLLILLLVVGDTSAVAATMSMRESTYRQLSKVHDLMQREEYEKAAQRLDALRPRVKHNDYEHAVVLQTYSNIYIQLEQYALAIEVIKQSLAMQSLPKDVTRNLLYLSAQLRIWEGDNAGALAELAQWFTGEKEPQPEPHALAGVAYVRLGDYPAAIRHLELAVNTGPEPQEIHMRQLLAAYLLAQRNRDAAGLLQRVVTVYPSKAADWLQLSAIYRELGDDGKALAVLELAHRLDMLKSEQNLMALVNYYLYLDVPQEAAKLLAALLKKNRVASNQEHWELLAAAWFRSKDTVKATQSLSRAASLLNEPELHLKRAQLAAAAEDWEQVLMAVADMQLSASLSKSGEVQLLTGIAHHRRGEVVAARKAFSQALEHVETRSQAQQWLNYLDQDS